MSLEALLTFQALRAANLFAEHANVQLPEKLDRWLRCILVTPNMHKAHHSALQPETDSNYGDLFPFWDRILRTYRERPVEGPRGMTSGLAYFREPGEAWLHRMLLQPFRGKASPRRRSTSRRGRRRAPRSRPRARWRPRPGRLPAMRGAAAMRRARRGPFVAALLALVPLAAADAAPRARLWERWTAHAPGATATVDHAAWDRILARYVRPGPDGVNRFAYAAVSEADRDALRAYLAALVATPISRLDRREQLAFWVNLYNALTVEVVLEHYPVTSIRQIRISPELFAAGPWGKKLVAVEGEELSLDDIEHRILRPIWRDPRIHYAVNCAALGCPDLQATAFTADNAEALLERGARAYVNHPRGARVEDGRLLVSSIYVWFQEDFGGDDAGVIAHLRRYAQPGLAAALGRIERIAGHAYDWSLNDLPAG